MLLAISMIDRRSGCDLAVFSEAERVVLGPGDKGGSRRSGRAPHLSSDQKNAVLLRSHATSAN